MEKPSSEETGADLYEKNMEEATEMSRERQIELLKLKSDATDEQIKAAWVKRLEGEK